MPSYLSAPDRTGGAFVLDPQRKACGPPTTAAG